MSVPEIHTMIKVLEFYRNDLVAGMKESYGENGKQNPDILGNESMFNAESLDFIDACNVLDELSKHHHWYVRCHVIVLKEAINLYILDGLKKIPSKQRDKDVEVVTEMLILDRINEMCLKILEDSNPFGNKKGCPTLTEVNDFFTKN